MIHYFRAMYCRLFFLIFTLLTLTACGPEPLYQEESYVFGTRVEVSIYGADEAQARAAAAAVMQEFQRLHDLLHAWKPSELSALNAAIAQGKSRSVPSEVAYLLRDAARFSGQSEGLFNPAIGGLIHLWGFQGEEFKAELPDANKIATLVKAVPQMSDLLIENTLVKSANPAVQLDLGGYAKGYALDRAAVILKQRGMQNALINIGGNVLALGQHGKRPWRVGIQHPRKPGPLATLSLKDGDAIGTSGDYQRFFELNGMRYSHLIDPRTGYPAQGVQAVTIVTHGENAGLRSDCSSKPLFINGINGWREAAKSLQVEQAMLIDAAGVVHLSAALQKRLEFTDRSTIRKVEP
ncbi:MAG: FAD:protein FMN transferase [Gallionellaceae bacterium]